jgi:hypothetical protein
MTIAEFLVRLANEPDGIERFNENPGEIFETLGVGLTEQQMQVLTAGRLEDIRYLVEADFEVPKAPEGTEQAAASAAASAHDAPTTETTTVSFVRPVWVRPVWIKHDA